MAEAQILAGDCEQRLIFERHDPAKVDVVRFPVGGVLAECLEGDADQRARQDILVQVQSARVLADVAGHRRFAGPGPSESDVCGGPRGGAHRGLRARSIAATKSSAAFVTRFTSPSLRAAFVIALPTPTATTPASNHSPTFAVVTPPAGTSGM